jgi:hypothetical protein
MGQPNTKPEEMIFKNHLASPPNCFLPSRRHHPLLDGRIKDASGAATRALRAP